MSPHTKDEQPYYTTHRNGLLPNFKLTALLKALIQNLQSTGVQCSWAQKNFFLSYNQPDDTDYFLTFRSVCIKLETFDSESGFLHVCENRFVCDLATSLSYTVVSIHRPGCTPPYQTFWQIDWIQKKYGFKKIVEISTFPFARRKNNTCWASPFIYLNMKNQEFFEIGRLFKGKDIPKRSRTPLTKNAQHNDSI